MPPGDAWAEIRIKLLVILFSRVVDVEDFCARCNDLPLTDALRLRHRLGILNLWDPRQPLKSGVLRLSRKDDRLVAKTILALAGGGSGTGQSHWRTHGLQPRLGAPHSDRPLHRDGRRTRCARPDQGAEFGDG